MAFETNLIEFISKEENNLLTSIVNFRGDIDAFSKVDGHFQAPTRHIDVPASDNHGRTILTLYLFTHFHLYLSTTTLLRCHLSDSFASTRKAIDATLTAYRLQTEPDTLMDYLNEHGSYKRVTRTIERASKKDARAYPLAAPLLHLHGVLSRYGSHADISSFAHRVKVTEISEDKRLIEHQMFQYPEDREEFRYYVVSTLTAYMMMLTVFHEPVAKFAKGFDAVKWIESSKKLGAAIDAERKKLAAEGLEEKAAMA